VRAPQGRGSVGHASAGNVVYNRVKAFVLGGGSADVGGFVLKRDRGRNDVHRHVLLRRRGERARHQCRHSSAGHVPRPSRVSIGDFEKGQVRRLLDADAVESDFKTAVLRFTDDGRRDQLRRTGPARPAQAARLAVEFEASTHQKPV
jgi:hypothetical protein